MLTGKTINNKAFRVVKDEVLGQEFGFLLLTKSELESIDGCEKLSEQLQIVIVDEEGNPAFESANQIVDLIPTKMQTMLINKAMTINLISETAEDTEKK